MENIIQSSKDEIVMAFLKNNQGNEKYWEILRGYAEKKALKIGWDMGVNFPKLDMDIDNLVFNYYAVGLSSVFYNIDSVYKRLITLDRKSENFSSEVTFATVIFDQSDNKHFRIHYKLHTSTMDTDKLTQMVNVLKLLNIHKANKYRLHVEMEHFPEHIAANVISDTRAEIEKEIAYLETYINPYFVMLKEKHEEIENTLYWLNEGHFV
jgi:hypothetical protein